MSDDYKERKYDPQAALQKEETEFRLTERGLAARALAGSDATFNEKGARRSLGDGDQMQAGSESTASEQQGDGEPKQHGCFAGEGNGRGMADGVGSVTPFVNEEKPTL